jgi:hypothetical protein
MLVVGKSVFSAIRIMMVPRQFPLRIYDVEGVLPSPQHEIAWLIAKHFHDMKC